MSKYRVNIMGDRGVGKSALFMKNVEDQLEEDCDPTIDDSYCRQVIVDGETCVLDILDTSGMEEYAAIRDQYVRTGDGFLLVFSVNDLQSFENIAHYKEQLRRIKGSDEVPMVLVASKCEQDERSVENSYMHRTPRAYGIPEVETFAKTGLGVDEAFCTLVREIRRIKAKQDQDPKTKTSCSVQ